MAKFFDEKPIDDFHPLKIRNRNLDITEWHVQLDPVGLRVCINEVWDRYRLLVFIAENGIGAKDVFVDGYVHDPYRIEFFRSHVNQMRKLSKTLQT